MNKYIKPEVELIEFSLGDNSLGNLCSTIHNDEGIFGQGDENSGIIG